MIGAPGNVLEALLSIDQLEAVLHAPGQASVRKRRLPS